MLFEKQAGVFKYTSYADLERKRSDVSALLDSPTVTSQSLVVVNFWGATFGLFFLPDEAGKSIHLKERGITPSITLWSTI